MNHFYEKYIANYNEKKLKELKKEVENQYKIKLNFTKDFMKFPNFGKEEYEDLFFNDINENFRRVIIKNKIGSKALYMEDGKVIFKLCEGLVDIHFIWSVTVVDDENQIVKAFDEGAEDYIVKPFDAKEVIARINAVTRRVGTGMAEPESKEVHYDKLSVNMDSYELKVNGKNIDTPPKELELLYYLASNPNRVYTRDQLLDEVWGFEYYGDSRTIDVHIKRLREKLEGVSDKWTLKTVWGVGYKFEAEEEE